MAEKGFKKGNIFPFVRQTTSQRPKKKFGGKIFFRPLYAARPGMHRACDTAESDPCPLHGRTRGLSSLQKIQ